MTEEEKRQQEADLLEMKFPGGKLNLTGNSVKLLIPYVGTMLLIGVTAYAATVIIGAMRQ